MHFLALFLAVLLLFTIPSIVINLVRWPFYHIQRFAYYNPESTAKMVIGFIVSLFAAYLFELPHSLGIAYGGAFGSLVLGKILS